MKVKNIIIAQDRYSILGGISTVNKLLGRAFDEAGYNVSYMALFDNTAGHPDAIEPDFVVNSGPLVNKTTHNRLVYTNPGPLGAALAVKKCFTVLWDCYNTFPDPPLPAVLRQGHCCFDVYGEDCRLHGEVCSIRF